MSSRNSVTSSKRYRRIMLMVLRFGMQSWWLDKTNRFRSNERRKEKKSRLYTKQAKEFVKTATEMGGLIIKLGQYISAQIGILPQEYLGELSKLQDSVAPVLSKQILDVIKREFGVETSSVFAAFDEKPIAAASLGQVYRARLFSGEDVAVKVLRPGIEDIIAIDLQALKDALRLVERRTKISNYMDADDFYREFKETLLDELDFIKEATNAEDFQRNLLENMFVDIPKIHWQFTTHKVLTMEYMHGTKINDLEYLDAKGIDRRALAAHLVGIYAQMILEDGFFHADPHPGNVYVRDDGTILLLDFGMVGRVQTDKRELFVDFGMAVALRDSDKAVESLRRLGFIRSDAETKAFAKNFMTLFDRMTGTASRENFKLSEAALDEIGVFMRSQPFRLPSNVMFLGKAIVTTLGLSTALDPDIDLVEEVRPYVEDLVGDNATEDVASRLLEQGRDLLGSVIPTLRKTISVVDKIDSGELSVRLSTAQERRLTEGQDRQTKQLVRCIIGAALFLSGTVLLPQAAYVVLAYVLLAIGGLLMLIQLMGSARKKKRRRHPGL